MSGIENHLNFIVAVLLVLAIWVAGIIWAMIQKKKEENNSISLNFEKIGRILEIATDKYIEGLINDSEYMQQTDYLFGTAKKMRDDIRSAKKENML